MVGMTNPTPHIQRNVSTAELVAALPSLTGVTVRNSVVVAPFWGKLTSGAMRIDLPDERTRSAYQRHAGVILSHLSRLDGCDRVAVAIFTDEAYDTALATWKEMLDHVLQRVHSAGFHIAEAAVVASDAWGCVLGDTGRRPLSELAAAERRVPRRPERPPLDVLPAADPDVADAVTRHVAARVRRHREPDALGILRPARELDPIEHFEQALAADPDTVGPATLAQIISLMQTEGAVDRTVLQAAFGREVARRSWDSTLRTRRRAQQAGCEPIDILEQDFLAGRTAGMGFALMLAGDTGRRPSSERLHRAALLLGRAVAHCQLAESVWALCALAWVRWALGLTAAAEELLRCGHEIDPANSLVPIYHALVTHCFPAWVYDRAQGPEVNRAARRAAARRR